MLLCYDAAQMEESERDNTSKPDSDERKLWLDYLKTLNDRRLQSRQRSGLTNYVLLALLAGIVATFLPKACPFLKAGNNMETSLTVFLLETDAVIYLAFAVVTVLYYVSGRLESRIAPESETRLNQIRYWTAISLLLLLALLHLGNGIRKQGFVRWAVLSMSLWFGVNVFLALRKTVQKIAKAKRYKIPVPQFRFVKIQQNWECFVYGGFSFVIGAFASYSLVRVLSGSPSWLVPLQAATIAFSCCLLAMVLLYRLLIDATQGSYDVLERDIILQKLTPAEIKSRFERQILGRDIIDWLDDLLKTVETADQELKAAFDSVNEKMQDVRQIDPANPAERAARAKPSLDEMIAALTQNASKHEQIHFKMKLFLEEYKGDRGYEILTRWVEQLKSRTGKTKEILDAAGPLVTELRAMIPKQK